MLWDTGFIFEEPDGVFGGNTEKAVKWFQEYALLEQTGVVDDRTIDSLYACWLQIMEENGYTYPVVMDDTGALFYQYGISAYPTTFMIDTEGNVFGYVQGAVSREVMDDIVEQTRTGQRR